MPRKTQDKTDTPNSGYRSINKPTIIEESKRRTYKDYADYLKSEKWKQVKADYAKHEDIDECLCCGDDFHDGTKPNYHHFRYPKDWNNDTYENLIIVCEGCHNHLHACLDHNSDPVSLRKYLSHMRQISNNIAVMYEVALHHDDIWCTTKGNFAITQKGMSGKKILSYSAETANNGLVDFFESRRDEYLNDKKIKDQKAW